mmetsp:Transcript_9598/g.14291  ORF Transcript_9598/g.14291 Transcript_9598/m.14291 type:complete len:217 (-) Transcript_9598:998-1648(-)
MVPSTKLLLRLLLLQQHPLHLGVRVALVLALLRLLQQRRRLRLAVLVRMLVVAVVVVALHLVLQLLLLPAVQQVLGLALARLHHLPTQQPLLLLRMLPHPVEVLRLERPAALAVVLLVLVQVQAVHPLLLQALPLEEVATTTATPTTTQNDIETKFFWWTHGQTLGGTESNWGSLGSCTKNLVNQNDQPHQGDGERRGDIHLSQQRYGYADRISVQ